MFTGKCYHSHFLIWIKNSSSSPSSFSGNCFISLIFFLIFLSLLWKESSYFWSCFKLGLITTNHWSANLWVSTTYQVLNFIFLTQSLTTWQDGQYYPPFTDDKVEAQGNEIPCPSITLGKDSIRKYQRQVFNLQLSSLKAHILFTPLSIPSPKPFLPS